MCVLSMLAASMFLSGCDAPGEGARAEQARAIANGVVQRMGVYYQTHGRYPASLSEIDPNLEGEELGTPENPVRIFYRSSSRERYEIDFKYFGPGSNTCGRAGPRDWVGISPDGNVRINEGGEGSDQGRLEDHLP
jgi:hypothetical protein